MNVMMVRAKIKEENVADAQAATEKVIQALEQAQPATCGTPRPGSATASPFSPSWSLSPVRSTRCASFPRTRRLVESLKEWYAEPPTVEHMTVIGSYRLF